MNYFHSLWHPGLSLNRGGVHMEGNGAGCGVIPPTTAPTPEGWDSDSPWPDSLDQLWTKLSSENPVTYHGFTVGEDLNGLWWVFLKHSDCQSLRTNPPCFPWHLPRVHALPYSPSSSSIALVCSAGPADLNCKCSLNKQNLLDTTLFIY